MKRRLALTLLLPATLLLAARSGAADTLSARLRLDPPAPYVNQPFSLTIEIETPAGCQMRDIVLRGWPDETRLRMTPLAELPKIPLMRGGTTVDVHRYRCTGRGLGPLRETLQPVLQATLIERRSSGFFSSWTSSPRTLRLPPLTVTVRPLPEENRPEGFAGAVGVFRLSGQVEPQVVMPHDLVTLTLHLSGEGYLGKAPVLLPELPAGEFKTYPPREERDEEQNRLTVTQVLIPLSTQAVHIAEARFPYFDPLAECYRVATAGPFALTFALRAAETPVVRHLPLPAASPPAGGGFPGLDAARRLEARRVLPYAVALLAALLGAALVRPWRPRLAPWAGLLFFAAVAAGGRLWLRSRTLPRTTLATAARMRIAPGRSALGIIELPAGTDVLPLDEIPGWVRAEAHGRRGWVPREALAHPPAPGDDAPDQPARPETAGGAQATEGLTPPASPASRRRR